MIKEKNNVATGGILFTGDWHCGLNSWGKNRAEEIQLVLDEITERVKILKPEVFVINGDTTDSFRYPGIETMQQIAHTIFNLKEIVPHIVMLKGNHDWTGLDIFNFFDSEHISFIQSPRLQQFNIGNSKSVEIAFVPYMKVHELTKNGYEDILQSLRKSATKTSPLYAAIHAPFENTVPQIREAVVTEKAVAGYDAAILGHIHTHKEILNNVFYSGSIIRCAFGEEKEHSGLWYIDCENNISDISLRTPYNLHTIRLGKDNTKITAAHIEHELSSIEKQTKNKTYLKITTPSLVENIDLINYTLSSMEGKNQLTDCIVVGVFDEKTKSPDLSNENKDENDVSEVKNVNQETLDCSEMSIKKLWESYCIIKAQETPDAVSEETLQIINLGQTLLKEDNLMNLWQSLKDNNENTVLKETKTSAVNDSKPLQAAFILNEEVNEADYDDDLNDFDLRI